MIIVGEKEKNNMSVSVRQRDAELDKQDMGEMSLEQVVNLVKRGEIEKKKYEDINNNVGEVFPEKF